MRENIIDKTKSGKNTINVKTRGEYSLCYETPPKCKAYITDTVSMIHKFY